MSFNQTGQTVIGSVTVGGNVNGSMIITGNNNSVRQIPTVGHIKFPKIPSFTNLVNEVRYFADKQEINYPVLNFHGTVKLHGTNACIIRDTSGKFHYQSRNRMITPANDNAGFAQWCCDIDNEIWHNIFDRIEWSTQSSRTNIRIYGEFVGKSIQQGVAISKLDKSFIIFGVYTDSLGWIDSIYWNQFSSKTNNIYNIHQFKTWNMTIDFNHPEASVERLEEITSEVGTECPVAKELGVEGFGEGIVANCINPGYTNLMFKSKSDKFKEVERQPKQKKDKTPFENYVISCCTEARLDKCLEYFREEGIGTTPQNTKKAIVWLSTDIFVEELYNLHKFDAKLSDVQKVVGRVMGKLYNKRIQTLV